MKRILEADLQVDGGNQIQWARATGWRGQSENLNIWVCRKRREKHYSGKMHPGVHQDLQALARDILLTNTHPKKLAGMSQSRQRHPTHFASRCYHLHRRRQILRVRLILTSPDWSHCLLLTLAITQR